ncbi:MAG: hypothetical protein NTW87_11540 [Planctomycetota bacterium]|nr:hypothetical protein [Planctomycetota bacterium]
MSYQPANGKEAVTRLLSAPRRQATTKENREMTRRVAVTVTAEFAAQAVERLKQWQIKNPEHKFAKEIAYMTSRLEAALAANDPIALSAAYFAGAYYPARHGRIEELVDLMPLWTTEVAEQR